MSPLGQTKSRDTNKGSTETGLSSNLSVDWVGGVGPSPRLSFGALRVGDRGQEVQPGPVPTVGPESQK